MTKRILVALLGIGLLSLIAGMASLAVFTSTASVGGNTFSTGSVTISTSPASALVTLSNMAPGDQVTAPITVTNAGTLALRYAITGATTENVLATQLSLTIKSGVTTCTNAAFGATGTVIYGAGVLGNTTAVNLVGNPAQGQQAGDRALASSANEVLCFNVSLPLTSNNTFQSLTTTATFAFQAEQTANNP